MLHNQSVSEFVIIGFDYFTPYLELFFPLFLCLFIFITVGNGIVMLVILVNSRLHKPMYLFICALSVAEIGIVTTVYPTMLALFLGGKTSISFGFCLLQMYAFDMFLVTENFHLAVMAFDRYVAICLALRYHMIMTLKTSRTLIFSCWLVGFLSPLAMILLVAQLPFCGPNEVEHIFCDAAPLLTLACTSTNLDVTMDLTVSSVTIILNSIFIVFIYTNILFVILKMRTSEERNKAFSTCTSHLVMACVFYGSAAFMYIQLQQSYSSEYDLAAAIHHSVLTPLLSPLVYSFRNKEISNCLWRHIWSKRNFY
ncbi:olfactory receptor 6N1-like [Hyperolius riggenbachi]|uniref:olfactory receptor 6N1-like n=1 Tax=Hyperolius riggenbachi TaxID=752182 RepID=UPI0035A3447C